MKNILFILSFISLIGKSQQLGFQWAKSFGGANNEYAFGVAVDGSGNVYSTGSFSGTTDFDPSTATFTIASASGSQDLYISKLNASGTLAWTKSIGGTGVEIGRAITLDASGNVYVTGFFQGTVDFDPSTGVFNLTSNGSQDIFIVKLNPAGNFVGAYSMGGANADYGLSITVDASGNIYTTGYYDGVVDFDPTAATFTLSSAGGPDIYVSKYNSSGGFVWAKSLGGVSPTEQGNSVKVDALGNVYLAGYFTGTSDFDPSAATFNMTSVASTDMFICKLGSTGNLIWAKQIGSTFSNSAADLVLDGLGNVITTGNFFGTTDFDPGAGVVNLTSPGSNNDCFVLKLDASGNYVWAKSFGGPTGGDAGTSVAVDASNNIYSTGQFSGVTDFDPGVGVYTISVVGSIDIFINKLDASGNFVAAVGFGGNTQDYDYSIAVDGSSSVYIAGAFNTTLDFDPASPVFTITPSGAYDAFVYKMVPCAQPSQPSNTTSGPNLSICNGQSAILNATGSGTLSWYATATSTTVLTNGGSYTTPTLSPGTYTYYVDAFTCMNSYNRTSITVTVNPIPTISVNSGSVCNGSTFTVLPNGASTYTYMNSTVGSSCVITPPGSMTFSLIGTSAAGCTSTAISSITVVNLPNITVGPPAPVTVCSGSYITLIAGGASTYTWVSGPVTPTFAVNPTVFSTYTVVGTSSLGCTSSNTINVGILTTPTVNLIASSANICSGDASTLTASGASSYLWSTSATTNTISVTPSTTTTYSVTGTTSPCSDTKMITISVTPSPTISIANSSQVICSGGSATLSIVGAASSYSWNTGPTTTSIVVSPTTGTTYTAAGFTGSCYGLAVTTVSIASSITVNTSATNTNICTGETTTITASGATTYTWSTSLNSVSIVVSPTTTTTYSVNGTSGSCGGSSSTTIIVNACVGIHEYENSLQFSIYPNPVFENKHITIRFDGKAELQVIDILGKVIIKSNLQYGDNSVDISNLKAGIYYFEIKHDNERSIKKLIKE